MKTSFKTPLLAIVAMLFLPLVSMAQSVCPPGYYCPPQPILVQPLAQEVSALTWYQKLVFDSGIPRTPALEAEAKSYTKRVGRMTVSGSCGSGSLVGRDAQFIWLMTNAHVATSNIGKQVNVECALEDFSGTERFSGIVVEAAYSSNQTTDWAIVRADSKHLKGIEPIKMSIRMPDLTKPAFTWGCPRCEVPSGQVVRSVSDSPVWQWMPNSIGGQSGSAVIQKGLQVGLLTWTWGGRGAGQFTATIYRQSKERSAESEDRPAGLIPVCDNPQEDIPEGYFSMPGEKRLCEIGNFVDDGAVSTDGAKREKAWIDQGFLQDGYSGQTAVTDLPIWADPEAPMDPPVEPGDPPVCPPAGLTPEQAKKLEEAQRLIGEVLKK